MGNNSPPPPPPKKMSFEDSLIEMRIQSKKLENAAKKSQKEAQKFRAKAKQALKTNQEDIAKLYANSASQKQTQSINYRRTALKMDFMCQQIKSQKTNQEIMKNFGNVLSLTNMYNEGVDAAKMSENLQAFNEKMDQVMINNQMMNQMMSTGGEVNNQTTDDMMNVLKQELALQKNTQLNSEHKNTNIYSNIKEKQQFLAELNDL